MQQIFCTPYCKYWLKIDFYTDVITGTLLSVFHLFSTYITLILFSLLFTEIYSVFYRLTHFLVRKTLSNWQYILSSVFYLFC